jgi:hypothetical protein
VQKYVTFFLPTLLPEKKWWAMLVSLHSVQDKITFAY